MLESVLTAADLVIFAVCFVVGTGKAAAARTDRDATLRITASVLLCASVVYLLSAPAVYRAVGTMTGSPSLPSLVVNIAILVCVGHAHALTLLWHPRRRVPDVWRRSVALWAPMYVLAIAAMIGLFWAADLSGPARPLDFATGYAHVPAQVASEFVYLAALVAGITATVQQCRGPDGVIALPGRLDLSDSVRLFAAAVALDLVYVACTAVAVLCAAQGIHTLDFLAAIGSVAASASALVACHGLAKPVLAARRVERADHRTLLPLWQIVDGSGPPPLMVWWNRRFALSYLLCEIFDGTLRLRPWMSPEPGRIVQELAAAGDPLADDLDLTALQAAATIRHARRRLDRQQPPQLDVTVPSGEDRPAKSERAWQVRIARCLTDPLVDDALHRIEQDRAAHTEGSTWRSPRPLEDCPREE
ncbi:DUF6545 domain-containing protein [Streptomyces sp. NBC_01361]|uniref:DUF6545 domain-containing protein n=1 Tax=Streptomyces sp. NBC_01361 TaxID=2903838 RepID=UPI002E332B97|nr:DUF6545 domain-containing protein [Streptomyces sp. NBC_01361]